jgi:hypothetical protein
MSNKPTKKCPDCPKTILRCSIRCKSCANKFKTVPAEKRFWKYVEKTPTCWIWVGGITGAGYGAFRDKNRTYISAHKFSWKYHFGEIEKGKELCHRCDNPPCVNPNHLWLGTAKENAEDSCAKNRRSHGMGRPLHKLKNENIPEIKNLYKSGMSQKCIGEKFSVSQNTIWCVVNNMTWKNISQEG